jgi:hypothetical protein
MPNKPMYEIKGYRGGGIEYSGVSCHVDNNLNQYKQHNWVPEIFLGGKGRPAREADNLTAICKPIV